MSIHTPMRQDLETDSSTRVSIITGTCHCPKPLSQWQSSLHMKAMLSLAKSLLQDQITVVIEALGLVLQKKSLYIVTSLLANGSTAFKWKLHWHWLKSLWRLNWFSLFYNYNSAFKMFHCCKPCMKLRSNLVQVSRHSQLFHTESMSSTNTVITRSIHRKTQNANEPNASVITVGWI